MRLFKKKEPSRADQFKTLRGMFYGLNPADLDLSRESLGRQVWGVVAEWNWSVDMMLFALADGTVSLYTSGFTVIGAGQHDSVRKVAQEVLASGEKIVTVSAPKPGHDFPTAGKVRFTFLTFDGPKYLDESKEALNGSSPYSDYFGQFQLLMAEIRRKVG